LLLEERRPILTPASGRRGAEPARVERYVMNKIDPKALIEVDARPIDRPTVAEAEEAVRTLLR